MSPVDKLLESCRKIDNKDVTALCYATECYIKAFDTLENNLKNDAYVSSRDKGWVLFDCKGTELCAGKTIRELLMKLIFC